MFGLLKADTLARIVADLLEAADEKSSEDWSQMGKAMEALTAVVGQEEAERMIGDAEAR